ncbi:MAG: FecR family protein, partial [Spirochaetaceae bacterium]|nr:FecR family protein [Spirochaetaceae bacterium]
MSVEKNVQRRRGTLVLNVCVYLFLSAGAFTGAFLLYRSIYEVIQRDVPPIGTLSFKLKSVERRFSGRMVWGNVTEESPVYSGDILRTGSESAAGAVLLTGDVIDMGENTLIQIFYDELRGARLELQDGQLALKTTGAPLTLKAGGKAITAGAGSAITVRSGEKVEMVTHEGSVEVEENGVVQTLAAGQVYTEDVSPVEGVAGDPAEPVPGEPALSVTQPLSGAEVASLPGGVPFSWDAAALEPDEPVRVEAARDPQFRVIAASDEVNGGAGTVLLPLREGDWWWRIYRPQREDGQAALNSGRLKVAPVQPQYDPRAAENLAPPALLATVKPDEPIRIPPNTAKKLEEIRKWGAPPPPPKVKIQRQETHTKNQKKEPQPPM